MKQYTKAEAIQIITSCSKEYERELANMSLLFIISDKFSNYHTVELHFLRHNFLHLTGIKLKPFDDSGVKFTPNLFYNKCLDGKLKPTDFTFAENGTTRLKLDVLPNIVNKNLSATMSANYINKSLVLSTSKLVGNTCACVGLINKKGIYYPNTLLKEDIRKFSKDTNTIVATFRKNLSDKIYSECVYENKNKKWNSHDYLTQFKDLIELH